MFLTTHFRLQIANSFVYHVYQPKQNCKPIDSWNKIAVYTTPMKVHL